jgi:hypothetical protein
MSPEILFCVAKMEETFERRWRARGVAEPPEADCHVAVAVAGAVDGGRVRFVAPSPPDRMYTFTGSGLPFPGEAAAFQGTPNAGHVEVVGGRARLPMRYPNSYLEGGAPTRDVMLSYRSLGRQRVTRVPLPLPAVPHRSLAPPEGGQPRSPGVVASQEALLAAKGYPRRPHTVDCALP